jgi:hypothetical protein
MPECLSTAADVFVLGRRRQQRIGEVTMADLFPLDQVDGIDATVRQQLAGYWITSAEELVSTARSANQAYGSGLKALGEALRLDAAAMTRIVSAAMAVLPPDTAFDVGVAMEVGDGLIMEGIEEPDATSFAPPVDLPPVVEPLAQLPPPGNQGRRNSCVAFTLAAMCQVLGGDPTELSAQFLYWACKDRDRIPGDVGTSPVVGMDVLKDLGVCKEQTWPYRPEPVDNANPGHDRPPEPAFSEAKLRRITGYRQLPSKDFRQIKGALAEGKPVLIGLPIWEHWTDAWQARKLGKVRPPLPGERRGSGHAMCVLGYRDDASVPGGGYFIVRNSWGPEWGADNPDGPGLCYVPYRVVFEQSVAAFVADGIAPVEVQPVAAPMGLMRSVGGAFGAGEDSLQAIYADAVRLRETLDNLIVRLAALTPGVTEAAPEVAPAAPTPAAPVGSAFSGPLILVRAGVPGGGEELYPNGIDGTTGEPLLRIDAASAARIAVGDAEPPERQALHREKARSLEGHFGVTSDTDPNKLDEARWAVVVHAFDKAELIKALWPLIEHRCRQMGFAPAAVTFNAGEDCVTWWSRHTDGGAKTLEKHWGQIPPVLIYRPGDRVNSWLARHGVMAGPVDPRRGVPYYLLLAARPGAPAGDQAVIPLNFQYELDIFWAVGRLSFTDGNGRHRFTDYTTYAERVVQAEQRADAAERLAREVVYFGTKHELDMSTIRSAEELITPMVNWSATEGNTPMQRQFGHRVFLEGDATRSNLEALLTSAKPPALLFTASHGLGLPLNDNRLVAHQGALVTQDWTGFGSIKREHWFAGEDLGERTNVEGMIAFLFACYGAGCPQQDEFIFDEQKGRPQIAPFNFVAQLPQRLLTSGMLAVLGHVERAWTYSFSEGSAKAQSQPFEDVIGRLMLGKRVGDATDQFNIIQGARSMTLTEELENIKFGKQVPPAELARLWMARNDARNYALLGDPAVKLPFA